MERLRPLALPAVAAALLVAAGGASAAPARAERPRAASVELRLPPGEDARALADLVAIAPGERLSARALRRTVQRLYQTGRFRNVVVRAVPVPAQPGEEPDAVALLVECLPMRRVASVQIRVEEEPRILDEGRLRSAAALRTGEPFDDTDLALAGSRILAAYARRGHRAARVEPSARGEEQVAIELRVWPGPATRVAALRLVGDAGPAERLASGLATRPGAVLDEEALATDVRMLRERLWRAGHRRARVAAPAVRVGPRGADVEIAVEAGPRIEFAFRGNAIFSAAELSRELGIEEGDPLDLPALEAAADRVRAFYRARGLAAARVETREVRQPRDISVVFSIDEGRRYRIAGVRVEGTEVRSEGELRARLLAELDAAGGEPDEPAAQDRARLLAVSFPGARPPPSPPPPLRASEAWSPPAWDRAAERVAEAYRSEGWLEAAYLGGSVDLDAARGEIFVRVRFREGPRTLVESISFEGNRALPLLELAREARLAPGEPLSYEKVEATRVAILRRYFSQGYVYARVEARAEPEAARHAAALRYVIEEGPQVHVGRILVTGNRRTREDLVRRALKVSEGDRYDPEAVARSQATLLRLGVFRSVGLHLDEPEVPDARKDLSVDLAERPWQTLSSGVGFSLANGPRAFVEYGRPNLFGRAVELGSRAKVNYPFPFLDYRPDLVGKDPRERIEGRVEVGVRQPRVEGLPFPFAVRLDAIGEILHRSAYDLDGASTIAGVDFDLTSRMTGSIQYELLVADVTPSGKNAGLTREDVERLRFGSGVTTLHSLRPSITVDYRDNAVHPRSGWLASAAVELAHSIGSAGDEFLGFIPGSEVYTSMLKLTTALSGYLPIGPTVLALSARGGRVVPLAGDSTTPGPKRFFLGGASSMRGYGEDEMIPQDERAILREARRICEESLTGVGCGPSGKDLVAGNVPVSGGGQAFLLLKGELRIRLRGSVEAGLFADVGNLWLEPDAYRLLDLRANLGFGLRFVTPIGPAALDFGFNVSPDDQLNERTWAPHFAIGLF